jgi:hypothetical protein
MLMRQNPRQTYRSTGSSGLVTLLLLSIVGSAVGLCLVVMKMTRSGEATVSLKDAQATASTDPRPINKPRRRAASSKKKDGATVARVPGRESSSSVMARSDAPSSEADQNTPMLNVKTDSTPVFQSNSANSSMVTSLKKGDKVRSGGLQIIDSQGTWTLVRGKGRSGFVPSELLEQNTPTEEAAK